jgi:cellulose synthase/poly-beta-1,6-N-acetylglucosamine synthase-like glycosyltransferase
MFDIMMVVCEKEEITQEAVERVIRYKPPTSRFIVLDNYCKGHMKDFLLQLAGEGKIERCRVKNRIGAPSGRNLLLKKCTTEFVLSLDDDVHVNEGWYKDAWDVINQYPKCAMVAPCGGRIGRIRDAWWPVGYNSAALPVGIETEANFSAPSSNCEKGRLIDSVPSMHILFRLAAVRQVGGFDPIYDPFICEDADLCFKLWEAKWEIRLARASLSHVGGGGKTHALIEATGASVAAIAQAHMEILYQRWEKKWTDAHKVDGGDFYPDELTEWEYNAGRFRKIGG